MIITIYSLLILSSIQIFADSPSFIRQEIKDGDNDWYYFIVIGEVTKKEVYNDERIYRLTNSTIGNINSVTYVSDGKFLNITFWLTASFTQSNQSYPIQLHNPQFFTFIDSDSNSKTGLDGADYINIIKFNNNTKRWKEVFYEGCTMDKFKRF